MRKRSGSRRRGLLVPSFVCLEWPAVGPAVLSFFVDADGRCGLADVTYGDQPYEGQRSPSAQDAVVLLVEWIRSHRAGVPTGWRLVPGLPVGARVEVRA